MSRRCGIIMGVSYKDTPVFPLGKEGKGKKDVNSHRGK